MPHWDGKGVPGNCDHVGGVVETGMGEGSNEEDQVRSVGGVKEARGTMMERRVEQHLEAEENSMQKAVGSQSRASGTDVNRDFATDISGSRTGPLKERSR